MDKDGFIGAMLKQWREGEWSDLDGCDMQEIATKYGMVKETKATQQDCEDWAYQWDIQPGDPCFKIVPEALKLMGD